MQLDIAPIGVPPSGVNQIVECSCPSCKTRFFEAIYQGHELPPLAYQFGKKKIYHLLCSYCTRLLAAPAFNAWAEKNLGKNEMKKPKKKATRLS